MEINFDTIKEVEVNGQPFKIDLSSVDNINALIDFREKYKFIRKLDKKWLNDCKKVINKILGDGAYDKLFEKDSIHAYFLVIKLCEIYFDEADKYVTDNTTEEIAKLKELADVLGDVAKSTEVLNKGRLKYDLSKEETTTEHKN